ncbi:3-deoxy-D-manno-octulosonic acid transferase [Ramlibacter henchirensis]|uniref:3-deoxy-D-manno-octulosonic acid transferase n=1 Tax=Ramlibacter henchirensis TaxID=204072 RepID=A0A4Z0C388_9BURK|nr:3-deoxy-D-manno-octulosonic acid transferase [Ramlibacter henchirensis]TFZ05993.1 3-deoxy-D-manno-octulosonic acid transferase [Ramlibacter henchirensis]
MIRKLYSLLMHGAQPLLRRKLRRRGAAEPGYLEAIDERFGYYGTSAAPGALWIHAVSLGETRAAALLVQALRERDPQLRLLLTHGTATGRAEGAKLLREGDVQAWLPWDTPEAVRRFLAHFQPCAGVLMETEVWPNLAEACKRAGVPLALANARLSEKSLRKALRLRRLSQPAYASLRAVWAQTDADAQRLARLGARVGGVFGNLKFDAQPDAALLERGRGWRSRIAQPVLMFASSREGEEAELFRVLAAQRKLAHAGFARRDSDRAVSGIRWLVVPRHPQRFDEVAALAQQAGLSVSRRSEWDVEQGPHDTDVWIGDSLGEMALYYGLADVALLGGSFLPLGGQNLIEAAACGCPVVMGPHTFNFAEAAEDALAAGAAVRVETLEEGVRRAAGIAADAAQRERHVGAAQTFAQAHRGAAERTATALLSLIA